METEAERGRDRGGFGSEPRAALDETTPADRAGWEAALAGETGGPGDAGAAGSGPDAERPAVVPEYEEDHPTGPPAGQDDLSIADLRPEVEGETPAERARRGAAGA